MFDPRAGTLGTLKLTNTDKLMGRPKSSAAAFKGAVVNLPARQAAPGTGTVEVSVTVPRGYKLNPAAPFYVGVSSDDAKVAAVPDDQAARNIENPAFPLHIPVTLAEGTTRLTVDLVVYYCEAENESVCKVKQLRCVTPLTVAAGARSVAVTVNAIVEDTAKH